MGWREAWGARPEACVASQQGSGGLFLLPTLSPWGPSWVQLTLLCTEPASLSWPRPAASFLWAFLAVCGCLGRRLPTQ